MSGKDAEAAAEYALGALNSSERSIFEARLAGDPALQKLVAQWQQRLAPIADDIAPVEPSSQLRLRLAAALAESPDAIAPAYSAKIFKFPSKKIFRPAIIGFGSALAACLSLFLIAPQNFWLPGSLNPSLGAGSQPVASVAPIHGAQPGEPNKPQPFEQPSYASSADCTPALSNVQTASGERPVQNSGVSVASAEKNSVEINNAWGSKPGVVVASSPAQPKPPQPVVPHPDCGLR